MAGRWLAGMTVLLGAWLCAAAPVEAADAWRLGGGLPDAFRPVPLEAQAPTVAPFERRLRRGTKGAVRGTRRFVRRTLWHVRVTLRMWRRWVVRGAFFLGAALLMGCADPALLNAWRLRGLSVLRTYGAQLLYAQVAMLFDRRIARRAHVALWAAVIYGVIWHDLVPDRRLVPGFLDDGAAIFGAVLLRQRWISDERVRYHAAQAQAWWRRFQALRRQRGAQG